MLVRQNKSKKQVKKSGGRRRKTGAQRIRSSLGNIGPLQYAPAAQAVRPRAVKLARISQRSAGTMSVTHTEYLMDVRGTVDFATTAFPINPARDVTFPWLSDNATRFTKYRFRNLCFTYSGRTSSSVAGEILLVVDGDASQSAPVTKGAAYAYQSAVPCVPWCAQSVMTVPGTLLSKELFTLAGKAPANTDIKTYNAGNLYVCTSGFAADGVVCGIIQVNYTVDLLVPITQNTVQSSTWSSVGGIDATHVFGTASVPDGLLDVTVSADGSEILFNQAFHGKMLISATGTLPVTSVGSTATVAGMGGHGSGGSLTVACNVIAERGDIVDIQFATCTAATTTLTPIVNG